jgi:hypothetical protein
MCLARVMLDLLVMKTKLGLMVGSLLLSSAALADTPAPDFIGKGARPHIDPTLVASSATNPIEPGDVVPFTHDNATLLDSSYAQVDRAALWLKVHPRHKIVLEGHTDMTGSDVYNDDLANRRIDAVRHRLMANGIPSDRIVMLTFGERAMLENPAERRVRMYATTLSPQAVIALTPRNAGIVAQWTDNGAMMTMRNGTPPLKVNPPQTARR